MARNAPSISHLFFADDTILFTRENVHEADAIKRIISLYERVYGQQINLQKTEITVSANIDAMKRDELSNILGVHAVQNTLGYRL